jgi:glycosyltransferase involved in cell wall biosynthesis
LGHDQRALVRTGYAGAAVLTVLSIAYPFAPVGPDAVGGAEQVLFALDRALVAAGHRSIVVASEGSVTAGSLVPILHPPTGEIDEASRNQIYTAVRQAVASAAAQADVIHLHGIDFHAYLPPPGKPALITLHLPVSWYPQDALRLQRADTWFNCVSRSQERTCPPEVNLVPAIPNGVPVEALSQARHGCRGFVLMLGRVCPEKGQHLGFEAAHRAGVPLLLAGEVFPYAEHRAYFNDCIRPLLDRHRRYLGPVGFIRKCRLLSSARCLLVPSLVPETSSLVAMEALACGTSVIAFPSGALPESVEHGRTGFLVEDVDGMAAAIGQAGTIDREICRHTARERFSESRMTSAYLALYQGLAACPR